MSSSWSWDEWNERPAQTDWHDKPSDRIANSDRMNWDSSKGSWGSFTWSKTGKTWQQQDSVSDKQEVHVDTRASYESVARPKGGPSPNFAKADGSISAATEALPVSRNVHRRVKPTNLSDVKTLNVDNQGSPVVDTETRLRNTQGI